MSTVINDRVTAQMEQPFAVFLIGMRVNKPLQFRKWMKVASAMPPMLEALYKHPEKGFLSGETYYSLFPLQTILVSYWRSFEDIERFARAKDDPHLAAWIHFNREIGYDGSVGVWHETYTIEPGHSESLYANMPLFGLGKAVGSTIPVHGGHLRNARGRMKGQDVEALPPELVVYE
ncbi:MAG: DUF4188 domain-containing protein [Anaerolineae bacterium]|nr:DUF4188 domain-containing protein [Anaerolineae bacterium]